MRKYIHRIKLERTFLLAFLFTVCSYNSYAQKSSDYVDANKFSAQAFNTSFNQISDLYIDISNELLKTNGLGTEFYFQNDTVSIQRDWFLYLTENIKNTSKLYTRNVIIHYGGLKKTINIDTFAYSPDESVIEDGSKLSEEDQMLRARNEKAVEFINNEREKVFNSLLTFSMNEYIDSIEYVNMLIRSNREHSKVISIEPEKTFHLIYKVLASREVLGQLQMVKMSKESIVRPRTSFYPIEMKYYVPIKYIVHVNQNQPRISHADTLFGNPSDRLSISTNEILMSFTVEGRTITYEQLAKKYIDECYQGGGGRWAIIINKGEYKMTVSHAEYNKVSKRWTCGTLYVNKGKELSEKDMANFNKMLSVLPAN